MRTLALFPWLSIFLTFFGAYTPVVSGQCYGSERSLLMQLKKSLSFNASLSVKLVQWNVSSDCCSWVGVSCEEGLVTRLDLSNEYISGRITNSSSLFNLQNLKSLDLSLNFFSSTIPPQIGNLEDLSYLNLSMAGFVGQVPVEISHLRSLVSLDLSTVDGLKLENPDLRTLVRNLSRLQELHLDGVNISARGTEWCGALSSALPDLRVLSLSKCYLSGPFDPSLTKLQSLSVINLDGNNTPNGVDSSDWSEIDWNFLSAEFGVIVGFGTVIGPLLYCKRWRKLYFEGVDDIVFRIFPTAVSKKWFLWT